MEYQRTTHVIPVFYERWNVSVEYHGFFQIRRGVGMLIQSVMSTARREPGRGRVELSRVGTCSQDRMA